MKNKQIKVGDEVRIIHTTNIYTLCKDTTYIVNEISTNWNMVVLVKLVGHEELYNIRRFVIDIKSERLKKLNKLDFF